MASTPAPRGAGAGLGLSPGSVPGSPAAAGAGTGEADLPFLDISGDRYRLDPVPLLHEARRLGGGMARSDRGLEVLTYAETESLLKDPRLRPMPAEHYENRGATEVILEFVRRGLLLNMDRADHDRVRRTLAAAFSARRVRALGERVREIADDLIDEFLPAGHADLVAEFTHRFSIRVLCALIGVPHEDIPVFERATLELAKLGPGRLDDVAADVEAALLTLRDYSRDLLARRRAEPRADLVSDIATSHDAKGLTRQEAEWAVANLLFAGHDTTRNELGSVLHALIEHHLWERLATEPALAEAAVIEGMRLWPVTLVLSRTPLEPVTVHGRVVRPGQTLHLNIVAATRDPAAFDDPDSYRLDRDPPHRIGFGNGPHRCLGAPLALSEMTIGVQRLTRRLTDVALADPPGGAGDARESGAQRLPFTGKFGGLAHLRVRFVARGTVRTQPDPDAQER